MRFPYREPAPAAASYAPEPERYRSGPYDHEVDLSNITVEVCWDNGGEVTQTIMCFMGDSPPCHEGQIIELTRHSGAHPNPRGGSAKLAEFVQDSFKCGIVVLSPDLIVPWHRIICFHVTKRDEKTFKFKTAYLAEPD